MSSTSSPPPARSHSRRCQFPDCPKTAKSGGLCISHGGGKKCGVDGCTTSVVSRGRCVAHGGGKRCQSEGCTKSAQTGGFCWVHGGGKKCGHDGCTKRAQSGGACISHGGGKRCRIEGCSKVVQYEGLCVGHGGYRRCLSLNCTRKALPNGYCPVHGGNARCQHDACEKKAVRGGYCAQHRAFASPSTRGGSDGVGGSPTLLPSRDLRSGRSNHPHSLDPRLSSAPPDDRLLAQSPGIQSRRGASSPTHEAHRQLMSLRRRTRAPPVEDYYGISHGDFRSSVGLERFSETAHHSQRLVSHPHPPTPHHHRHHEQLYRLAGPDRATPSPSPPPTADLRSLALVSASMQYHSTHEPHSLSSSRRPLSARGHRSMRTWPYTAAEMRDSPPTRAWMSSPAVRDRGSWHGALGHPDDPEHRRCDVAACIRFAKIEGRCLLHVGCQPRRSPGSCGAETRDRRGIGEKELEEKRSIDDETGDADAIMGAPSRRVFRQDA